MARNEQLIRQHKLLELLEYYRYGRLLDEFRDEVVQDLGLSNLHTRTIRRDLQALQRAGVPVLEEVIPSRGRVWRLAPGYQRKHKITASVTELVALSMGRDLMLPLAGTPFWVGIESFWNKLNDEIPAPVREHYDSYRQSLFVRGTVAKSYERHRGIVSTLNRCIHEHRVAEIEYQPIGRDLRRREIEPLAVVFHQSSLYIIAAAHETPVDQENRLRHFKLDRFSKATALDKWFKPPQDFDLKDYLGKSLGIFSGSGKPRKFRIHVSALAKPWVLEDPWHEEQVVEPQADGSIILNVLAAHDLEIVPRVLALGNEAELLSPRSCRRLIAKLTQKMSQKYQDAI